jgi:hypothetical protein
MGILTASLLAESKIDADLLEQWWMFLPGFRQRLTGS